MDKPDESETEEHPRGLAPMLAAQTAESLEGVAADLETIMESEHLERHLRARLYALRDAVVACCGRVDAIADILDDEKRGMV